MTNKRNIVLSMIKRKVLEIDSGASIFLYGPRASGDERADSDWDILILTDMKADMETEQMFRHQIYDVELELGESISIFVYNRDKWKQKHWMTPLYNNIKNEGITI
ncbi:MAG: nucleotidyltransferase domain-containing protein [Bacteroidota bacterium]|nr:nucleotidyltransferase domain-containing protein [Bacteroidota bacterium]